MKSDLVSVAVDELWCFETESDSVGNDSDLDAGRVRDSVGVSADGERRTFSPLVSDLESVGSADADSENVMRDLDIV